MIDPTVHDIPLTYSSYPPARTRTEVVTVPITRMGVTASSNDASPWAVAQLVADARFDLLARRIAAGHVTVRPTRTRVRVEVTVEVDTVPAEATGGRDITLDNSATAYGYVRYAR